MWLWLLLLLVVALIAFGIGRKPGPCWIEPRDEEVDAWQAFEALEEVRWKVAEACYQLYVLTMRLFAPREIGRC
ncbi:MAG TPA: hypothetical protein VE777_19360 [Gaiellales bacterium]|jgi:hypothetical protein|nr:hypothetical protein [Gaiellales bacterium]